MKGQVAKEMIQFITFTLDIKESMLAALLNVTVQGLRYWEFPKCSNKVFQRLVKLDDFVRYAKGEKIPAQFIYCLLHEPVDGDNSYSILHYCCEDSIYYCYPEFVEASKRAVANFTPLSFGGSNGCCLSDDTPLSFGGSNGWRL